MAAFPEGHRDSVRTWRQFRQEKSTPVIIISAREEETDAVLSLELAIAKALVEAMTAGSKSVRMLGKEQLLQSGYQFIQEI